MLMGHGLVLLSSILVLSQLPSVKPNPVRGVAFAKDGKVVFAAQENNVFFLRTNDGVVLAKLKMDSPVVSTLTLSDDGKTLAVAHGKSGATGEIVTYLLGKDHNSATPIFQLKAHNDLIQSLSFSPDGKFLAASSEDQQVRFWSVENFTHLGTLSIDFRVKAIAFGTDSNHLFALGNNDYCCQYDVHQFLGFSSAEK